MFARALPSFFTVGNLFLGIVSILITLETDMWRYAAMLVIISMLLDGLDGRVARMLNTQSEFGKELDSLSDVISFGVAPAVIMYVAAFRGYISNDINLLTTMLILTTTIFPICGALRLARFNVQEGLPGYFTGLPITAAGGILATMAVYKDQVDNPYLMMLAMIFLSYLMVSQIKYPAFKAASIPKIVYFILPIVLLAVSYAALFKQELIPRIIFIPLAIYAIYGVKKTLELRREAEDEEVKNMK